MEQDQPLTHADVERIIQLAEEGGFSYVRLESDGVEVTLMRDGYVPAAPPPGVVETAAVAPAHVPPPATPANAPDPVEPAAAAPARQPAGSGTGGSSPEAATVVAPMIGIVYLAHDPTAEPYVRVGQAVAAGDTVALIEVMKMFTPVRAESAGVVRAVLVESGQHVDRGQPLMLLEN